jgi:asparagine synthase (glutamine-hydrolysing)
MCGFAGFLSETPLDPKISGEIVTRMCDAISHRGPDDSGIWNDPKCHITLGHRRLSIMDISKKGAQPMCSVSNRWVIAFNGEIYNHLEIRAYLEDLAVAPKWRGHSDTETLLAGFDALGINKTLSLCVGM